MRRSAAAGLLLAALYLAVVGATAALSHGPVRPVFDGFAPPSPYKWVNPPPGLEKDNQQPAASTVDVPLDANGSAPTNSATSDGQAIAGLDTGSVPAHFPDTMAALAVKPVDAGRLGPLPAGLRAEGNAYQVTITYQPSGAAVTTLPKPGTIALTAAAPADALLYSADGARWDPVAAQAFGNSNGQFAPMNATGYYLAASHNPARAAAAPAKRSYTNIVVGGVAVAVISAAVAILLRAKAAERRRAAERAAQRKARARKRRR